jgi:murein DD-endopeptidase MepM/ murein hydrolase activator NlpD
MHAARRTGSVALLAAVVGLSCGLAPGGAAGASDLAIATTTGTATLAAGLPNAAHPYSDPVWSPLRTPARVSCVLSNCPGPYHGYWAIDFISQHRGEPYDPLYAAGAGIFHIGGVIGKDDCSTQAVAHGGTWVWIDHGAGRTTQYAHLNRVMAREGQLVTPATQIGEVGHNGNAAPCQVNYLHMEYHTLGYTGPKVAPGIMMACTRAGRVSMPSQGLDKAYPAWNSVLPVVHNTGPLTPAATNTCMPATWASTPARPVVTARGGPASATVSWGVVPAGVGSTVVTIQQWHPSKGSYGNPVYRTVTGRASSTRFTGLLNGRPYRWRTTTHNSSGNSAWSSYVTAVPSAVPSAPRAPRALSTTRDSIRYAWWLPASNGAPITRFVVARRCLVSGAWTGWVKTNVAAHAGTSWNLHYSWTGLPHGRTCNVMVQAVNSAGSGPWSTYSRATTLR